MGNNKDAQDYYYKSLDVYKELYDEVRMAQCYWRIAKTFELMSKSKDALECYNKALEINTELNDRIGLTGNYNNIGLVYWNMSNL